MARVTLRTRRASLRKKVCVVFPCLFVFRDPAQDILKPRPFINAVCLAGGKQGVDHGCPLCGVVVTAEQIVLAPCVGPAAQELLPFHPLEVFVHDVTVALDGSGEVLQQTHGHAGAPGAMFIEEEPVSRHHVHHTPYISLHRAALFIVYYRQCALVHLNVVAGDVAAGVLDHRLFSEWCPQDSASYGQEPIRNLCPGVLPLPPEVLVLWNAFLFQQGLDCCPFLPGLALDLFDLFACKHVS